MNEHLVELSNRLILTLEPVVQPKVHDLLRVAAREGMLMRVHQARRTFQEQTMIYAKGRIVAGEPCLHGGVRFPVGSCPTGKHPLGAAVTNAPAGYSIHNFGRAVDICEMDKTPFDLGEPGPSDDDALWDHLADIGESLGFESGFRWKQPDPGHFEYLEGTTLLALREQARKDGLLA
jgi:hypothetical protein